MNLFGILFDMDGVIADTNPFHKDAIQRFCERYNIRTTEAFLRQNVYGRTNKEWIPELMGEALSPERLSALADEKEAIFRDIYRPHLQAVDGLLAFLEQCKKAGLPMVVATSAPGENAQFILEGLGIRHYFQAVLDSSDVDKGKPHPEVYQKAAAAIQLPPEHCIVLEDSLAGVKAGKAAGSKVLALLTTHTKAELSAADAWTTDFVDVDANTLRQLLA